jgi:hypothetical protein
MDPKWIGSDELTGGDTTPAICCYPFCGSPTALLPIIRIPDENAVFVTHHPSHPKFDMQSFDMQTVEAWR